jgi:uncharacterized integral membrane protein (TIGR00697 family)
VNRIGTPLLIALYVACELIANITAGRPIALWEIQAPGGVVIYALTFTLIDLVNEKLGKTRARQVVIGAFCANALLALYSAFVLSLPAPSYFHQHEAFYTVLGATPRIITASLLAYLLSSWIDIEIFAAWKARIGGRKWARVLASNAVSTAVDSTLFVTVAFAGTLPLLPLITGQYIVKMAVTLISLPLIYATRFIGPAEAAPEPPLT